MSREIGETIELEIGKHKKFEILSLLFHFYNKGYLLSYANYNYQHENFDFVKIDRQRLYSVNEKFIMPNYQIQVTNEDYNNSFYYGEEKGLLKTRLTFFYDSSRKVDLIIEYNSSVKTVYRRLFCSNKNTYFKEDEEDKFFKTQNKAIEKLSFYELYSDFLSVKLVIPKDINIMFNYKKFIQNIMYYQDHRDHNSFFRSIYKCWQDMVNDREYSIKNLLKFRKKNQSLQFSIGRQTSRTVNIENPECSPFFDIFIPVFNQLGGVKELNSLIFKQRLIEE
jgi:hypothetical protein